MKDPQNHIIYRILCFGIARDIVGSDHASLSLPSGGISIGDIRQAIVDKWPAFNELSGFALACNEKYAVDEHPVKEGDVLAILPPVSGG